MTDTQATRIFAKFGGVPALKRALDDVGIARDVSALYRWNLPHKNGGTGGLVPSSMMKNIFMAARYAGIVLTPEDLYPAKGEHDV